MFDSILDSLKGEVGNTLMSKLGLSEAEVDKTMQGSKEAMETTITNEAKNNGMDTLVNLFSDKTNTSGASNLLGTLGSNLISSLTSKGFDSSKSSSIATIILPVITNLLSSKIGGDSSNLTSILGSDGISDMIEDKAKGFLKGLF
ncbi:hypothetical protein GCM10011416_00490 [Polaribacter pacificus]|uniref:DUF937 domain-containing protein n=1 Tax=Polaribacter pacificus TaxID=1775173 RepID=A0A917HRH5_9FLAO|nr:hypothetical protein [Polaribacter pacificus]GGG88154.1 hypothetical protein GCM10011416_00490 [Polaribacter pacificus]